MAEKNSNDLFQWNFNLTDTDSDFTDISYSRREETDPDIDPSLSIFVPSSNGKASRSEQNAPAANDAGAFVDRYVNASAEAARSEKKRPAASDASEASKVRASAPEQPARKSASRSETGSVRKSAQPKRKKKKNYSLNWPMIIIAAVVLILLIVVLVLLLKSCGKENNNKEIDKDVQWTISEQNSAADKLVCEYLTAKVNGDAGQLRKILDSTAVVNSGNAAVEALIYEEYDDIVTRQTPGINSGEYALCTTYDVKFYGFDTRVPAMLFYYARPDSDGVLRLMRNDEYKNNEEINSFIQKSLTMGVLPDGTKLIDLHNSTQQRYDSILAADPTLKTYITNLRTGNYTVPFSTTEEEVPKKTEAATQATQDTQAAGLDFCAYISADNVRFRSAPSTTDSEIIGVMAKGTFVHIIAEVGDWYQVQDILTTNGQGGTQECSNMTGFIHKDYIVESYSDIQ